MNNEIQMSIEVVRKALLESEKEKTKIQLAEIKSLKLSSNEMLKRFKENTENNDLVERKYLGCGAFEETVF